MARASAASSNSEWPWACKYYDSSTMDADQITRLFEMDTIFKDWHMAYTTVTNGRAETYLTTADDDHKLGLLSDTVLESRLTVIHVRQIRICRESFTASSIALNEVTWRSILDHFDILPSFLNVLHTNNGGSMSHATQLEKDASSEDTLTYDQHQGLAAYHVCYKMGHWGDDEVAIYSRHDLTTGRQLVLVLGTDQYLGVDRVRRLLGDRPDAHFFHVVLALMSTAYHVVEGVRWHCDFNTQQMESLTGIATRRPLRDVPLKPHELKFNKDLQVSADFCRTVTWGSSRVRDMCRALQAHLNEYASMCGDTRIRGLAEWQLQNLREACELNISLATNQHDQTLELQTRLQSQIAVTRTLMAQRDTQINLDIASATRRDSELMKGIAAVTMIFLPATFVATFFSMVFFHVGEEATTRLTVDRSIWLYPLVTLPLTVGMTAWYFAWSSGWASKVKAKLMTTYEKRLNDIELT